MKSNKTIRGSLRRALLTRFYYRASFALARGLAGFVFIGWLLVLTDRIFSLSRTGRIGFWSAGAGFTALWAVSALGSWRQWRKESVALEAGRFLHPADDLLNSWDLTRRPPDPREISPELTQRTLDESALRLSGARFGPALRPARFRLWFWLALLSLSVTASGFILLPSGPRSFLWRSYFPFGTDDAVGVAVSPGDARVAAGESLLVRLEPTDPSAAPELWIQGDGLGWERCPLERTGSPPVYTHLFENIISPLSYKARCRGRWTPVYSVAVFRPPQFQSLRVEQHFPRYTGKPVEATENSLALRTLRGGRLRLKGRLNQKVSKVSALLDDGRSLALTLEGGRDLSLIWDAYESGGLSLQMKGSDLPASDQSAIRLTLEVTPDEPPAVKILSPAQDLLVSPRDKIPLTYEVADDFGVAEVALMYQVNGGETRRAVLKKMEDNVPSPSLFDALWRLEPLGLKPGDRVKYFLSVRDNNSLTGPGEGASAAFSIEVASYESEHRGLEEALESFQKELVKLLGDQVLARDQLGQAKSPEDWKNISAGQSELKHRLGDQNAKLDSLVKKMARDPLMDQVSAAEYKALAENLRQLERDAMSRAETALAARQKKPAVEAMDETVSELERLSLLAEDVLQSKRMRDVLLHQEDLTQAAESMVDRLAQDADGKLSAAEQKELADLMSEASRLMQGVMDQLQKMPQDLPEDFVNQEAMKNLRFDEVQSAMQGLREAMRRGDASGALAQAKKMLAELKNIQKTLNDSAQKTPGGPGWLGETLLKEVRELQKRLQSLIERQEDLKTRTQSLFQAALDRLMAREKELLKGSAEAWDAALAELDLLMPRFIQAKDVTLSMEARIRFPRLRAALDRLRQGVRNLQIQNAQREIDGIHSEAGPVGKSLDDAKARLLSFGAIRLSTDSRADWPEATRQAYASLDILENEWKKFKRDLSELEKPFVQRPSEKSLLTDSEKDQSAPWAAEQGALSKDTLALRRDLQVLARQTATLGTMLARRLKLASDAMDQAQASLSAAELRPAVESQETALRHLRDAQDGMESSSQGMSKMKQFLGQPMTGSVQPASGSAGVSGAQSGPVRIPRAEDFRPPKEFREEVLKSMKERYPKTHERVIQDYYERWAK